MINILKGLSEIFGKNILVYLGLYCVFLMHIVTTYVLYITFIQKGQLLKGALHFATLTFLIIMAIWTRNECMNDPGFLPHNVTTLDFNKIPNNYRLII